MKIEKLDYYGRGISRSSGKVYFIENALKDEDVSITLLKEKKKYCEAKLKEISNISKDRTEAKCKYYNVCGGCQLMHIKEEKQEEFKKEKVEEILKKFLKYNKDVNDIVFSKNFNYRNKVVLHVKDKKLGFYKNKTNELIEIDKCLLLNPVINDLISYLKNYIESKDIEKITIKVGNKTNEVMLIIDGSIAKYQKLLEIVVKAADSKRAEDTVALDVQGISILADYFVITQANSERQVKAIADAVKEQVYEAGADVKDIEGKDGANWILLDLGDVVVHVFKTETRQFYNLEKLWSDAPLVDIADWIK